MAPAPSRETSSIRTIPTAVHMLLLLLLFVFCHHHVQFACVAKELEVTDEWQMVGENDTVPAGVHVRIDMSTGEKWVKLAINDDDSDNEIDKDKKETATTTTSSSLLAVVSEDGSVDLQSQETSSAASSTTSSTNNYDFDMMHRTLSKLPDEEKNRMGGLPQLPQATETTKVTPEERKAFEERMLEIWIRRQEELASLQDQLMDLPAILRERIKAIDEYLKDPPHSLAKVDLDVELPEGVVTHIVSVLDDLQFQVSDIDMARDFHTMGGWPLLVSLLSDNAHVAVNTTIDGQSPTTQAKIRRIQALAAETMGTSVKNTGEFFPFAVESIVIDNGKRVTTAIDILIEVFCRNYSDDWDSRILLSKSIYAIGAMLRGNRLAQTYVFQQGGLEQLGRVYKSLSSEDHFSSATVKLVMRLSSLVSDILEDLQLHPELGDSATTKAIIDALTSKDWCDANQQAITSETFLPIKVQESILHSVATMAPYCQWGEADVKKIHVSLERMKVEWKHDQDSFDMEHWEQLQRLAATAFAATEKKNESCGKMSH
ncbi:hypothetical protein IV203_032634 [Nitzschia inconspicua]|uniref:Nucleotide exchange factor SIL1 n=1 Tax=Nitzschia inconspicua TaxID=303405 RepID=A0A9K3PF50_9STRA|nr:hypothetical protein IV203_032634 [Nitzschia inconspicua]